MVAIVAATRKPYHMYNDVAKQFRVTSKLVGKLVFESKHEPEKIEMLRRMKRGIDERKDAIQETVTDLLGANKPITSSKTVQAAVHEQTGLKVSNRLVRHVMRKELGLDVEAARAKTLFSSRRRV